MKRLPDRKSDIEYLKKKIGRLPESDDTFKATFIVATAANEKPPQKFTDSELQLFKKLGINTNKLSHQSVGGAVKAKKRAGILSSEPLITALVWILAITIFAGILLVSSNINKQKQEAKRAAYEAVQTAKLKDCQTKAPYFQWQNKTTTNDGYCFRVRYPSKQACIDDGKEKTAKVQPDRYDDAFIRTTTCNDDGTWTSRTYDPEYEDYKQQVESQRQLNIKCKDVTSYDYNWSNDMLCTRPDGSQFYTSYEGARGY